MLLQLISMRAIARSLIYPRHRKRFYENPTVRFRETIRWIEADDRAYDRSRADKGPSLA